MSPKKTATSEDQGPTKAKSQEPNPEPPQENSRDGRQTRSKTRESNSKLLEEKSKDTTSPERQPKALENNETDLTSQPLQEVSGDTRSIGTKTDEQTSKPVKDESGNTPSAKKKLKILGKAEADPTSEPLQEQHSDKSPPKTSRQIIKDKEAKAIDEVALVAAKISRREVTRELLRSEAWDTTQLPPHLQRCIVAPTSRLPSPLAEIEESEYYDELHGLVANYPHPSVRRYHSENPSDLSILYDLMATHDIYYPLCDGPPHLLIFGHPEPASSQAKINNDKELKNNLAKFLYWDNWSDPVLKVPIEPSAWPLEASSKTKKGVPAVSHHLDIHRVYNYETGEDGYFVVVPDKVKGLTINESALGTGLIAGPLPDFAMITVGGFATMWYRSASAWGYVPDYMPPAQGLRRKRSDVQESLPWQLTLEEGMTYNRVRRQRIKKSKEKWLSKIKSIEALSIIEVIIAIASVWAAIKGGELYAYGGLDVFDPAQYEDPEKQMEKIGAVGKPAHLDSDQPSRFIMPLLIPDHVEASKSDPKGKGKQKLSDGIDHLVLVIAELSSCNDQGSHVKLDVFDSYPTKTGTPKAQRRERNIKWFTQKIITDSGWLSFLDTSEDMSLSDDYHYHTTPRQEGINACGMYVILNAWAAMLGIPVHPETERRTYRDSPQSEEAPRFLTLGLEIINLALAGCMDTRTIQAYLNVHGYSVSQDSQAKGQHPKHLVNTIKMDQSDLRRYLQQQLYNDNLAADASTRQDIDDSMIEGVRSVFPNKSNGQICTALVLSDMDKDGAIERLASPGPSPPAAATWFPGIGGEEPDWEAVRPKQYYLRVHK